MGTANKSKSAVVAVVIGSVFMFETHVFFSLYTSNDIKQYSEPLQAHSLKLAVSKAGYTGVYIGYHTTFNDGVSSGLLGGALGVGSV